MAIFHLSHCFVKRSNGSSVIAKAAYNAGQKLEDGKGSFAYSDYSRKAGVLYDEITLPKGSPIWANNRGELWRGLEAREDQSTRRSSAILAHNLDVALPHELSLEQLTFLARDFVREQFTRKGYAVDWAIHAPDPRGDARNIHLHILVPLRKIDGDSFGLKDRYTKQELRQKITGLRKAWASLTNRHLTRYGHEASINERSLLAQGSKRQPTRHKGPRPKSNRLYLNKLRAKQPPKPQSPVVRTVKSIGPDGSITLKSVITHTALSGISQRARKSSVVRTAANLARPIEVTTLFGSHAAAGHSKRWLPKPVAAAIRAPNPSTKSTPRPTKGLSPPPTQSVGSGGGWPPEAMSDWRAWGNRDPARFFAKWPELGSGNTILKGGLNHDR